MSEQGFYTALAQRESRGDPRAVNSLGFMGLYQMGPLALEDAGYMRNGNWTGRNNINTQDDFLNNVGVQNEAVRTYHFRLWSYIPTHVRGSAGSSVGNINITKSGLLAGAHLLGQDGVTRFIESNGQINGRDDYGTPISEYIRTFGGYDVSSVIGA